MYRRAVLDRTADLDLLGLEIGDDGRGSFELTRALSRLDGRLYGGVALAVGVVLGEVATDRPAVWCTVQFVSGKTTVGDRIDTRTEVLALGRRTAQVRVRAFVDDTEVFCSLGATGRLDADKLTGTYRTMPRVLPVDECPPFRFGLERIPSTAGGKELAERERTGMQLQELRIAAPEDGYEGPPGQVLFWARLGERRVTPAVLGYLADLAPMAIAKAAGRIGGGTSLDNTIRFSAVAADTDWVLAELDPHLAAGGYGHGSAHLWSPDGDLLATASQTATMMLFD
jgi:acyl-CoA thioesterase II